MGNGFGSAVSLPPTAEPSLLLEDGGKKLENVLNPSSRDIYLYRNGVVSPPPPGGPGPVALVRVQAGDDPAVVLGRRGDRCPWLSRTPIRWAFLVEVELGSLNTEET